MTLDELRALLTPERLDQVAAHNCGASDLALVLASALTDALIERDALRAEVARLTGERDALHLDASIRCESCGGTGNKSVPFGAPFRGSTIVCCPACDGTGKGGER